MNIRSVIHIHPHTYTHSVLFGWEFPCISESFDSNISDQLKKKTNDEQNIKEQKIQEIVSKRL